MGNTTAVIFNTTAIYYNDTSHSCSLLAHFVRAPPADSYDLALIKCPTPIAVPPSRVSNKLYSLQTPIAMVGFSRGTHADVSRMVHLKHEPGVGYAFHTQFSRLADSFQDPLPVVDALSTTAAASRGFTEDGLLAPSFVAAASSTKGFVSHSPPAGMSGGTVMDMDCGVFGVTERQSTHGQGGRFVLLTPAVIQLLAAAIRAPSAS
jgi:hypothetical protein